MGLPLSRREIDDQPRAVENVTADDNFMRFLQMRQNGEVSCHLSNAWKEKFASE
jgi:hypothetical protein